MTKAEREAWQSLIRGTNALLCWANGSALMALDDIQQTIYDVDLARQTLTPMKAYEDGR